MVYYILFVLRRLLVRVLITKLSNGAANHLLNMRLDKQVSTIEYMNNELLRGRHGVVHVHYELRHGNIAANNKRERELIITSKISVNKVQTTF